MKYIKMFELKNEEVDQNVEELKDILSTIDEIDTDVDYSNESNLYRVTLYFDPRRGYQYRDEYLKYWPSIKKFGGSQIKYGINDLKKTKLVKWVESISGFILDWDGWLNDNGNDPRVYLFFKKVA